MFKRLYDCK